MLESNKAIPLETTIWNPLIRVESVCRYNSAFLARGALIYVLNLLVGPVVVVSDPRSAGALFLHTGRCLLLVQVVHRLESDIALSKSMHSLAEGADIQVQ